MGDVNLEIKLNNLNENIADLNTNVDKVSSVAVDNGDWLKSKNLLPCTVSSNGIFTVNTDGSVKAKGTPSGTAILQYNVKLPIGSYVLNGCPSGGSNDTYSLQLRDTKNTTIGIDKGNGYSFTLEETKELLVLCRVASGVAVDVTYYPMIRKAGTDSEYVPYVKSNVELASDVAELKTYEYGTVTATMGSINEGNTSLKRYGKVVTLGLMQTGISAEANKWTVISKVPTKYIPSIPLNAIALIGNNMGRIQVNTNGNLQIYHSEIVSNATILCDLTWII